MLAGHFLAQNKSTAQPGTVRQDRRCLQVRAAALTLDPRLEKRYSTVQDSLKVPHFKAKNPHNYPGWEQGLGAQSTPHTQHFTSQTFLALRRNRDRKGIQELHGVVGMAQKRHHRHLV